MFYGRRLRILPSTETLNQIALGAGIFYTLVVFILWSDVNFILIPNIITKGNKNYVPYVFRGGFQDCKTLEIMAERVGKMYSDEDYYTIRDGYKNEPDLAREVSCDNCFSEIAKEPNYLTPCSMTCQGGEQKVQLLLVIKSAPYNFARRNAVRKIWLNHPVFATKSQHLIRHIFIIGQTKEGKNDEGKSYRDILTNGHRHLAEKQANYLKEFYKKIQTAGLLAPGQIITDDDAKKYKLLVGETLLYDDIVIIDDFIDSYDKLMYKSMASLRWIMLYCNEAPFIASMDDDTFVFLDKLLDLLKNYEKTPNFIGGNRMFGEPNRDPFSKWYISPRNYAPEFTPDFYNGALYVMSNDTVAKLWDTMPKLNVKRLGMQLDDFIITGFARAKNNIKDRHICNFSIGSHPWRVKRFYEIQPWTIALLSTPRNTWNMHRAFQRHFNITT